MAQQLSNGRNVSGSWAVTETLNAWYVKDHSIAVCYERRLQTHEGPLADANTLIFRDISDMTGQADGFVSVENDPKTGTCVAISVDEDTEIQSARCLIIAPPNA